jgi:hypothetical protein
MANEQTYVLSPLPRRVAKNKGTAPRTYVLANVDPAEGCELLGLENALGEGIPVAAGTGPTVDLAPGETLYAAAATAVELRVLELRKGPEPVAIEEFAFPGEVDDMTIARLPFYTGQRLLSGGVVPRSGQYLNVEWHGTGDTGDPERGSFVMVREGSPAEELLLGERLKLTYGVRWVWAYCHITADLDEDLSLTRRLFLALAPLSLPSIGCYVEIVG